MSAVMGSLLAVPRMPSVPNSWRIGLSEGPDDMVVTLPRIRLTVKRPRHRIAHRGRRGNIYQHRMLAVLWGEVRSAERKIACHHTKDPERPSYSGSVPPK